MANKTKQILDNVAAIRVATDILRTGRKRTDADVAILRSYKGFGGCDSVAFLYRIVSGNTTYENMIQRRFGDQEYNAVLELAKCCKECSATTDEASELARSIVASITTAYYTPSHVVDGIGKAVHHTLDCFGIKATSILEPSAGTGGFLPVACAGMKKTAFEIDYVSARILWALNPDTDVYNCGFETIDKQTDEDDKPLGQYDLAVSNIPFGRIRVTDNLFANTDEDHRKATLKLHTYFFMKTLERLNNGGILAFITSRGTSDSPDNQFLREWMVHNGNLLSAVRLPDNMFQLEQGVAVGSDLIVFQRDQHKGIPSLQEQMWCQSVNKQMGGQTVNGINRLLGISRQAIYTDFAVSQNQYGKYVPVYRWSKPIADLGAEISRRVLSDMTRNFRKSAWLYGHDTLAKSISDMESRRCKDVDKRNAIENLNRAARKAKQQVLRPAYDAMMAAYTSLMSSERCYRTEFPDLRQQLNDCYDEFCRIGGGNIHANEKWLGKDYPEYALAMSLENLDTDGSCTKADVFYHPIAFRIINPDEVFSPKDALQMSLNEYGDVNIEYMSQLAHTTAHDLCESLKDDMFLTLSDYKSPQGSELVWQPREQAIAANVIAKRKVIEQCLEVRALSDDERTYLLRTASALRLATPAPIGFSDIQIPLGARWVPCSLFERFFLHLVGTKVHVSYIPASDIFSVKLNRFNVDYSIRNEYEVSRKDIGEMLEFSLKDNFPNITYKVGDQTFVDHEAMRKVQRTIDRIKEEWKKWIRSSSVSGMDREVMERIYNERFNNSPAIKYHGENQTFTGLCLENLGFNALYPSQMDAIWMIKANRANGAVCWHEVGAGKTLIAITAAMDGSRLGLWTKPMIIGMKANVDQIFETARKAYPSARILYPGKADFTKANRSEFFNRIANNDWDLIILSHSQFKEIPQDAAIECKMMQQEVDDMEEAYKIASKDTSMSHRAISGMLTKITNLKNKLEDMTIKLRNQKRDGVVTFADMNVGILMVDEYQEFKNLKFQTKHERLAGLGNTDGSQRAWNLLLAIRTIQQRTGTDGGAVFFSGTIITNALTELYVLFKYLRPNMLIEQGLRCFDAWMGTFAEKTTEYELSVTGEIKQKERIRRYKNVPEIIQQLGVVCDYRSAEMINLDRPTPTFIQDFAEPTAEQEQMIHNLVQFANSCDPNQLGIHGYVPPADLRKSIMLVATGIANKVALDPRLLNNEQFSDDPNSKLSRCARRIREYYDRYQEHRGVQFVFSNLGTYDKQHKQKWNAYSELRRKLVQEYGIPQYEIAFIHDWDTPKKKLQLFAALNKGDIRVVMGSTDKLGTGVNAQQRAVAAHHLDVPWRPSDMEQRNGRVIRKGNEVKFWAGNNVDIIVYGTERTLDAYKYSLLNAKQTFIKQIADGSVTGRTLDEGAISTTSDGKETMNFAEYVALLSGNQDLQEEAKLNAKIEVLNADKARHLRDAERAKNRIPEIENELNRLRRTNQQRQEALITIGQSTEPLLLPQAETQDETGLGRLLFSWRDNHNVRQPVQIGTWHELPVLVRSTYSMIGEWQRNEFTVRIAEHEYVCNESGSLGHSHHDAVAYFDALPARIESLIKHTQADIDFKSDQLKNVSYAASMQWADEDELRSLTIQRDMIHERITAELNARDEAKRQSDEAAAKAAAEAKRKQN